MVKPEPSQNCALCPRLVEYRRANIKAEPDWFNGAVGSFGETSARLLVVGLAPGVKGANRTGRPFTGDHAGVILYNTLLRHGFAAGRYGASPDDGLTLVDCMITNAVRCVPPANKPLPVEVRTCSGFLAARINSLPKLAIFLALGRVAHDATLSALGERRAAHGFAHGAHHNLANGNILADSYHCSRYNTNTGVLTEAMFDAVFADIRRAIDLL